MSILDMFKSDLQVTQPTNNGLRLTAKASVSLEVRVQDRHLHHPGPLARKVYPVHMLGLRDAWSLDHGHPTTQAVIS